jgi:hypothetical protein
MFRKRYIWNVGGEFIESIENTFNRELAAAIKELHNDSNTCLRYKNNELLVCNYIHYKESSYIEKEESFLDAVQDLVEMEFEYDRGKMEALRDKFQQAVNLVTELAELD